MAVTLLNFAANVLVSRVISGWLGLRDRWPHDIAAWAWLHAVTTLLLLPVVGALDTLTLDGADALALLLAVAGVALVSWIGWFAAVAVLGARPWAAVGLVVADFAVITAISAAAHFPLAA